MGKDYTKGRGVYTDPIELKYIQIPHDVFKFLYVECSGIPDHTKYSALYFFVNDYFTNSGFESLKLVDFQAYLLCRTMKEMTGSLQNNGRWKCFDEFYKGRNDIDYELAWDMYIKEQKEKKAELNRRAYQRRKTEKEIEEMLAAEQQESIKNLKKLKEDLNSDKE